MSLRTVKVDLKTVVCIIKYGNYFPELAIFALATSPQTPIPL